MSKNKKKKKGGYKPPTESSQDVIDAIVKLATDISAVDEPGARWGELHKLFLKSPVDAAVAAKIIMHKDLDELHHVVEQLQHGEKATVASESTDSPLPELSHQLHHLQIRNLAHHYHLQTPSAVYLSASP